MQTLALKSQRVITEQGMVPAVVVAQEGVITDILPVSSSKIPDFVEDLGNLVLMPGLVDSHVHINEPGRTEWEGFNTATQAAAAGGITTLVDMPLNCVPVTTSKQALDEKLAALAGKLWVDCGFWGGIIPQSISDLDELLSSGVLGAKSFLIDSGIKEFPEMLEQDLRRAMPIMAKHGLPYLIHAELDHAGTEPASIGNRYQSFLASRPKEWENDAIELMIKLCRELKADGIDCRVHIVHLSSAEAVAAIASAQAEGLSISAETCPHYLTLWAEAIPDGKTLFKCCPPIREQANREMLWQAIKDGVIEFIVSDHSPCTPQLKNIDSGDIENAWGGISALQFGLPLIWTEAKQRGFELTDMARLMATKTAEFAGLGDFKGKIAKGYQADFLVFDDSRKYPISNELVKHRHKITPYEDKEVQGEVCRTYLRGELVYTNDKFVGSPKGQPILAT